MRYSLYYLPYLIYLPLHIVVLVQILFLDFSLFTHEALGEFYYSDAQYVQHNKRKSACKCKCKVLFIHENLRKEVELCSSYAAVCRFAKVKV